MIRIDDLAGGIVLKYGRMMVRLDVAVVSMAIVLEAAEARSWLLICIEVECKRYWALL